MYNDPFLNDVWSILVNEGGADPTEKDSFLHVVKNESQGSGEYRFQGLFGFGGKFYWNRDHCYVSCYREDETPERKKKIAEINERLKKLVMKEIAQYRFGTEEPIDWE
jgi:hypothetical protein